MAKKILYFPALEREKPHHYMPLSLLSVASTMLDENIMIYDERLNETPILDILHYIDRGAKEVLFTAFTGYQLSRAYKVSRLIKLRFPRVKITFGGPHATLLPEQALASPYVDEVFVGYAERGENLLPWHLINVKRYVNPETERFIYVSSYSCPGACAFCQTNPRRELVFLPLEKVERDIENLLKLYPFRECVFFDASLFTKPERALFIANLMQKHRLRWIADSRADEIVRMPPETLDKIMETGLTQLTIGLESGSPKVVDMMRKGKNHLEKYRRCAEIMSRYDVTMASGVIFGCPGEGPEDIKQTIEYVKEVRDINPNFRISSTFFKPLPKTIMSDIAKQYGYHEPQTLEEWAAHGEQGHYVYNQFESVPWVSEIDEYRRIYEEFRTGNKDLFI